MVVPASASAVRAPKLATVVARQIEQEVVDRGWPEGEVLGSEAELLERFGVSRAVLREAVRIVEHTGAARMRRGPGGGLVVAAFNRDAVTTAMSIWLSYLGVTVGEMLDTREPLFLEATRLAADRRDLAELTDLRTRMRLLADGGPPGVLDFADLDRRFTRLCRNPAVALFADVLTDVLASRLQDGGRAVVDPPLGEAEAFEQLQSYERLADALERRDRTAAMAEMRQRNQLVHGRLRDQQPDAQRRRRTAAAPKLAERVASEIRDDIEHEGWPVGQVLGSEAELIERYDVSRAILREAVRILEYHGAVRTKRGPGGGLVVTVPDGAAVLRSARIALEYDEVTADHLLEVRSALDVAAARMAAERLTETSAEHIRRTLERERSAGDRAILHHEVHRVLAEASSSRPLALFIDITAELVSRHVRPQAVDEPQLADTASQARRAHQRIVEAVLERDPELAARRMLRHLNASLDVLQ